MTVPYRIIRSNRKTLSIQITVSGEVVVRAPRRASSADIEAIVLSKQDWIACKLRAVEARREAAPADLPRALDPATLEALTAEAKATLPSLVADWAAEIGVTYGRVTIRHQSTRWGSCSSKGNLNFNCLLMLCPPEVQTYVVIHELCHRRHMNHSAAFWEEVRRHCPSYEAARAWLKENGAELIRRLKDHA